MGLAAPSRKTNINKETGSRGVTDISEGSEANQATGSMTVRVEIHQDISQPRTDLLTTKNNAGFLNAVDSSHFWFTKEVYSGWKRIFCAQKNVVVSSISHYTHAYS